VGTVFVTILLEGHAHEFRQHFAGDALKIREQATLFIYDKLSVLLERRQAAPSVASPSS
jgi:nicotinamide mononucleotide (NMN) deamidase PncC